MQSESRQAHWQNVYTKKGENEVSWFQENPAPSLDLIAEVGGIPTSAIIDIGGGASRLVDHLIDRGFDDVTVLDLSEAALESAKTRLGTLAATVHWIVADVTAWEPQNATTYGMIGRRSTSSPRTEIALHMSPALSER
jgi:hypothetical protein